MATAAPPARPRQRLSVSLERRRRELVTPEGLALPLTLASRGSRLGAMLLDLMFLYVGLILFLLLLVTVGINVFSAGAEGASASPAIEFIVILIILLVFVSRYGYFLFFELGPRGATPGKRLLGIRVAARPGAADSGGRLTAEAIIARNLMRDIELFLPVGFLFSLMVGAVEASDVTGWLVGLWTTIFLLFPFFNKDRMRAGDLVAGTWVVEAEKVKLAQTMSTAPDHGHDFPFGPAELAVYGEHELQVLESVLRQNNPEAMREVMFAICRKIGWQAGIGYEREFLEAFYKALRGHLESGMRMGKRKADKFS